jgi:two-component system OmpR family response regulator
MAPIAGAAEGLPFSHSGTKRVTWFKSRMWRFFNNRTLIQVKRGAMRLLLVEDDPDLGPSLQAELKQAGFVVDLVQDGAEAEFQGSIEPYDLIVLDLGLPTLPGLAVLKSWRASGNKVPVLVLTARDTWHERVEGLEAGADDYLGKPFHSKELLARIRAVVKRSHGHAPGHLRVGDLLLDEATQTVSIGADTFISLSATEFRMLRTFMLHPGQLLSKGHLAEHVYDAEHDVDTNLIEVYINKLRRKLGQERIVTRRGQGYLLTASP